MYEIYKHEYLDSDPKLQTKAKKEQVTFKLLHSMVGAPLADIPLDVIAPATMHVILGVAKKMYEWLLGFFSRAEEME